MSQTLLVSIDDTIVDLHGYWTRWVRRTLGTDIRLRDVTSYETWLPEGNIGDMINKDKNIISRLPPMEGAIEAMDQLRSDFKIIYAGREFHPESRLKWFRKWLPWVPDGDVILSYHTPRIKADFFVSAHPDELKEYRALWGDKAKVITIDWPFNRGEEIESVVSLRAYDFADSVHAWGTIVRYMTRGEI